MVSVLRAGRGRGGGGGGGAGVGGGVGVGVGVEVFSNCNFFFPQKHLPGVLKRQKIKYFVFGGGGDFFFPTKFCSSKMFLGF